MTEARHVSKHQWGRPAGTTGWWGIKCIWHNRFLWWCHDRNSSTNLASVHRDSTLFEEHRPCFLQESAGMASLEAMHIQQCRNTLVTWLVTIPLWCDQKQFYVFIVYLIHQVYCIHCGTTAKKDTSEVFVSLQPRAPGGLHVLSCYSSHQWGEVYLPDKGTESVWAAKFCKLLTTLSDGDVSRLKLYIAWCQGMFLKWLTRLCFNRMELNAPLPPLAAHIVTPDGTHRYRESMCKADQPPCQLMRPRRINNRVETDTYLVCIGFRMTNT